MKRINLVLVSFVLGALFAVGAIYWSMEAENAQAANSNGGGVAQTIQPDQRAIFKVESISCGACEANIRAALSGDPGVAGVEVNFVDRTVAVDFAKSATNEKKLGALISEAGYPAEFLSFAAPSAATSATNRGNARGGCGGGSGRGSCCGG